MTSRRSIESIALVALVAFSGCGYGPVSPAAYEHAKELLTLANMKATQSLDAVEAAIEAKVQSGELPEREANWLLAICDDCRAGRWADAQAAARRLLQDQVRS